jgi:hypothetical protein
MIIQGDDKCEIGKIYQLAIYDAINKVTHRHVPTMILKEVTFKEYNEYCIQEGVGQKVIKELCGPYYYEVSID